MNKVMYKAVIFDLYGTLVDIFIIEEYETALRKASEAVGAVHEDFRRVWHETTFKRNTGEYGSTREAMQVICDMLEISINEDQIKEAADSRKEFVRKTLTPRSDAVSVLRTLRESGIKTALLSNCSPDTEELWSETPLDGLFDVQVFSSSVGMKKPDPKIYQLVTEKLGVKPEECIFVGDGDSNELTGAKDLGIYAVQIKVDYEPEDAMHDRQEWNGPGVRSLTEVLNLVSVK